MPQPITLSPPIVVSQRSGVTFALSTIEDVIDYVQRYDPEGAGWPALRDAAFVAAAVPSEENIETLRQLAADAFESLRWK